MSDSTDIRGRVRAGATLLDKKRPGWAEGIDVATLDMLTLSRDVVAQIYGNFLTGLNRFGIWGLDEAGRHGFIRTRAEIEADRTDSGKEVFYAQLTAAWLDEIDARLAPAGADTEQLA